MRRRAASSLFLAVVASVALAACGADPSATAPAATAAPTTGPIVAPSSTGASNAAPSTTAAVPDSLQFSADLVAGGQLDFRKYAGQTLALWFWAPT